LGISWFEADSKSVAAQAVEGSTPLPSALALACTLSHKAAFSVGTTRLFCCSALGLVQVEDGVLVK
jgi:hypothetical protein